MDKFGFEVNFDNILKEALAAVKKKKKKKRVNKVFVSRGGIRL